MGRGGCWLRFPAFRDRTDGVAGIFRGHHQEGDVSHVAPFFATQLLEDGVDIRYIQELLGHGSIETTKRYTHVTQRGMERIKSPLDSFKL